MDTPKPDREKQVFHTYSIDASVFIKSSNSIDVQPLRKYITRALNDPMHMNYDESIAFATEISQVLHDPDAFPLYLSYVTKHPEETLRQLLARTLAVPGNQIRKTRGALFTYLVEQYAKRKKYDPRD
jgi:hypothetical protein